MSGIAQRLRASAPFQEILRQLSSGLHCLALQDVDPGPASLITAAIAPDRTTLLLVGSQEAGETALDALSAFAPERTPRLIGHSTAFLEESAPSASTAAVADRLTALDSLTRGEPALLVTTPAGLLQHTWSPDELRKFPLDLRAGRTLNLAETLDRLVHLGYTRSDTVQEQGEFAVRGGILDLYPAGARAPVRVDLFGDEVESLRRFDPATQRSSATLESVRILPAAEPRGPTDWTLLDHLPEDALILVASPAQIEQRWVDFEREVKEQIQAMMAGLDESPPLLPEPGGDEELTLALRLRAPEFPFLALDSARSRLEQFQTIFLGALPEPPPWGVPTTLPSLESDPAPRFNGDIDSLATRLIDWTREGLAAALITHQWPRLAEMLRDHGIDVEVATRRANLPPAETGSSSEAEIHHRYAALPAPDDLAKAIPDGAATVPVLIGPGALAAGFVIPSAKIAVLSGAEIFGGPRSGQSRRTASKESAPLLSLVELSPGDRVVHIDHGVGIFRGLKTMEVEGIRRDYLWLEYAQGDKLYVPSDQVSRVQRYIGSEDHPPPVHRLGGSDWSRTRRKVRESVEAMARELLALYAARATRDGHAFGPDTPWQNEMEQAFPYEETGDQLRAIQDLKGDLESDRPMDRLICGDVGYGKTEVAIRAAFKVVMGGKQVAVLVPTTVLAQQHFNTFTERLSGFPVRIEMLSRFRSRREQLQVVEALKQGQVDIVIGTHRLLSKDVAFKDLGMLVVDEEQRFGVGNKEKLKQLRNMVDVLTLTATPIPRTLHMALSTIRDMSVMNDAPEGRTAIRTYLREYTENLVRESILRELERDGQVYFVHNRVDNLAHVAESIRRLVPQARVGMAHGQMAEHQLEQVMLDFYARRYDVLCCTTIIESGLDIPNVNTICINDADRLGLAQLYQLRGRVGRSNRQAYCYLLFRPEKELTEIAHKRLEALREFSDLGSGFRIALRDLEIRGAGNLLGAEQHGAMMTVGFDLYCRMIADAVRTLRNEPPPPPPLPPVDLSISALIPPEYVSAESVRIELYRRLQSVSSPTEVQTLQEELQDRFGPLPTPAANILAVLRLRVLAREIGVTSIAAERENVIIRLGPRLHLTPTAIASLRSRHPEVRFLTDRVVIPLERSPLGAASEVMASLRILSQRRKAAGV